MRHAKKTATLLRDPLIDLSEASTIWVWPDVRRSRSRDSFEPFSHYADSRSCKRRARCLAKGCQRRLRVDQRGVCSERCRQRVRDDALAVMVALGVPLEELLRFLGQNR